MKLIKYSYKNDNLQLLLKYKRILTKPLTIFAAILFPRGLHVISTYHHHDPYYARPNEEIDTSSTADTQK